MEYVDFLNIEQIYYWIYLLISYFIYLFNPLRWINLYYENWSILMFYSLIFSVVLLVGIIYIRYKMVDVAKENSKIFDTVVAPVFDLETSELKNERWEKIIKYINSDSPAEWRMAILDADVILDEMMTKVGFQGENLGEKLRQVEKSDFTTINSAWEAHKIRNQIAHESSDSILTQRTAKRAISLYKEVFKEFEFI